MTSSQKAGILSSTATNIFSEQLDDDFQAWLADALNIEAKNIKPVIFDTRLAVNLNQEHAFFFFNSVSWEGLPSTIEETDETQTDLFTGSCNCRITLVGKTAREKAFFLHDSMFISQNVFDLLPYGLGIQDVTISDITQVLVGDSLTPLVSLDMVFNYEYQRVWDIRSIKEIQTKFFAN